jgi:hypothetical protein
VVSLLRVAMRAAPTMKSSWQSRGPTVLQCFTFECGGVTHAPGQQVHTRCPVCALALEHMRDTPVRTTSVVLEGTRVVVMLVYPCTFTASVEQVQAAAVQELLEQLPQWHDLRLLQQHASKSLVGSACCRARVLGWCCCWGLGVASVKWLQPCRPPCCCCAAANTDSQCVCV